MGTRKKINESANRAKDHPHAYGDKPLFSALTRYLSGSSPRVWGQASEITRKKADKGIIPTRMGTRCAFLADFLYGQDHPHAYGDKIHSLAGLKTDIGSSPRVWGQEKCTLSAVAIYRIIPTRMGTSNGRNTHRNRHWDHPHAYGDKNWQ